MVFTVQVYCEDTAKCSHHENISICIKPHEVVFNAAYQFLHQAAAPSPRALHWDNPRVQFQNEFSLKRQWIRTSQRLAEEEDRWYGGFSKKKHNIFIFARECPNSDEVDCNFWDSWEVPQLKVNFKGQPEAKRRPKGGERVSVLQLWQVFILTLTCGHTDMWFLRRVVIF